MAFGLPLLLLWSKCDTVLLFGSNYQTGVGSPRGSKDISEDQQMIKERSDHLAVLSCNTYQTYKRVSVLKHVCITQNATRLGTVWWEFEL